MGKATIVSNLGKGHYRINVKYNTTVSDKIISQCTSRMASLDTKIAALDSLIAAEESKLFDADHSSPPADWKTVFGIKTRLNGYKRQRYAFVIERESSRQKIAQQQLISRSIETEAWCADLTEDLSGDVGTIEPTNIRADVPIIQPGYDDGAAYITGRDGCLQHALAAVPEATFWNLAMFPGWRKYAPLYRTGSILILDTATNTATVSLHPATCSQHPRGQTIDLNVEDILSEVPIRYMN